MVHLTPTLHKRSDDVKHVNVLYLFCLAGMAFSNHIPLKSNQFTGRDKDMKYLLQTIENNQLIVITGPPGIGKTTFAIQVAHELLKDNPKYLIQFIDLRCIDSIETITAKIFQCFSKIPEDRPAQQLCNFLRLLKRAVVLLFDNSEDALTDKLKEQYFGLIKQILVNCPSVKVLCTSREKFRLLGVNSVIQVLDALENDDATSLLQSSVPHLGNENARKLANVCGCAPLALTIISYLIRDGGIDPGRLIKEIDPDSSNPIDGYRSESLPKQSQLGPVIDSSYIRLTQEQQHAFCCLSIFPSAFNIEAAEFVLDTDDINRTLAALNLRSLLSYDAALDRYSLHSYLRAFAKCKLDINSSESIVKPRFAIYYARLLKDLAIKYYSGDFQPAVYKVRLEGPNIIKMLLSITEQNELYVEFKELADKFVVRFIYMFIPTEHFVLFYSELLKAAETRGDRKTSSYCYFCQAYHFRYIADFQKATDLLKLALSLGKEEGVLDEIDVAIFQSYLAWCYGMLKDYFKAKINLKYVTNFLDKKENKRDENQDLSMAFLLNISGNSCNVTGDIKNALEFGKKALEIWRHFLSDHLEVARELYNMGIRLRKVTRSEEALSYLTQAQNIFDTVLGKCGETARNLHVMGRIHYDFQDYRKALQFLHMAAEIQETVNGCDSIEFKESYYLVQYIERQLKE